MRVRVRASSVCCLILLPFIYFFPPPSVCVTAFTLDFVKDCSSFRYDPKGWAVELRGEKTLHHLYPEAAVAAAPVLWHLWVLVGE